VEPKALEEELNNYIRPLTFPLGIKMLSSEKEIPERSRRPLKDMKKRVAICQAYGMGRKLGWAVALGKEDMACSLGAAPFGFHEDIDYFMEGNLCSGMFTANTEAGRRSEEQIDRFPFGRYSHILIAPLARIPLEPDVVLIYGLPAQVMRLVHGALYAEGGAITSAFEGRLGCASVIPTMKKEACQVLLPGNGDRIFGMTQDHEMAFIIPWSFREKVVAGLQATHKFGIRYPITSFLNFEAVLPPSYRKLDEIWKEKES
jgi:uncharacterized protein (DUF169 family)